MLFVLLLMGYKSETAIDISSGRVRHRTMVWNWALAERIRDTEFSRNIKKRHRLGPPRWKPTSSHLVFQQVSPNYVYGSAPSEIENVVSSCRYRQLSRERTDA